jgi:hypothetical protein
MTYYAPVLFLALLLVTIALAILHRKLALAFKKRLAIVNAPTRAGSFPQGMGAQWQLTTYLFRGDYKALRDEQLDQLVPRLRAATIAYIVVMLAMFGAFLLTIF